MGDLHDEIAAESDETSRQLSAARERLKRVEADNADMRRLLGVVERYEAARPSVPRWAKPKRRPKASAATACLLYSDQHLDEVVNPTEVNGHNAYDRDIAVGRNRRTFEKAVEQAERTGGHDWEGIVVFWAGDTFSGTIHEELRQTNAASMPDTLVFWCPQIAAGFRQLADFYGKVHVVVVTGNHGRLTQKPRMKGRARDNWDWLAAHIVASHFETDDRVTFDISDGADALCQVYDTTFLATHGDKARGGHGIGGVWPPIMRLVAKLRATYQAQDVDIDCVVMGHWHQYVPASTQGFIMNGSSKGWDEFAAQMGFAPEPPQQAWWVVTPGRGITVHAPLFTADRKAEGW